MRVQENKNIPKQLTRIIFASYFLVRNAYYNLFNENKEIKNIKYINFLSKHIEPESTICIIGFKKPKYLEKFFIDSVRNGEEKLRFSFVYPKKKFHIELDKVYDYAFILDEDLAQFGLLYTFFGIGKKVKKGFITILSSHDNPNRKLIFNNMSFALQDNYIRRQLHLSGFYEVLSENKASHFDYKTVFRMLSRRPRIKKKSIVSKKAYLAYKLPSINFIK